MEGVNCLAANHAGALRSRSVTRTPVCISAFSIKDENRKALPQLSPMMLSNNAAGLWYS